MNMVIYGKTSGIPFSYGKTHMLINTIKFTYQKKWWFSRSPMDPTQEDFTLVKDRGFLADDLLQAISGLDKWKPLEIDGDIDLIITRE